jgi:hypothetical protein
MERMVRTLEVTSSPMGAVAAGEAAQEAGSAVGSGRNGGPGRGRRV